CAIEWAERAAGLLPPEHLMIELAYVPGAEECRTMSLHARGRRYETLLGDILTAGDAEWS
ncbi:MAG: hypothetical protein JXA58_02370, partial [Dehalococcoidia bacterium]|nr:hypothetical protein [Dehalococcoidia bacterium]